MGSDFSHFNARCHGPVPLETAIYSEDTSLDRVDLNWSTKSRAIPKNLAPCGQVRTLLDNLTGEAFVATLTTGVVRSTSRRGCVNTPRRSLEPHLDRSTGEFSWGFGLGEPVPRGQLNGVIMMARVGDHGAWARLFNAPNLTKFEEPTVVWVDYPAVGISQAWVDLRERRLAVATYVPDPARRGE